MRHLRIVFLAVVTGVLCYGWYDSGFHQETDQEFKSRICAIMGWQPDDIGVDINLCRMLDEELRRWK